MTWASREPATAKQAIDMLVDDSTFHDGLFRGQPQLDRTGAECRLVSTLHRALLASGTAKTGEATEGALMRLFRSRAYCLSAREAHSLQSVVGTLQLMQHYGAPTRLLDWTTSPFVAAYFAALAPRGVDGVIWAFGNNALLDAVDDDLEFSDAIQRCGDPFEWLGLLHQRPGRLLTLMPDEENLRMTAQQGTFTLATTLLDDHSDVLLANAGPNHCGKMVIRDAIKQQLLQILHRMNISRAALFPGPDGVGGFCADVIAHDLPRAVDAKVVREHRSKTGS